jgi:hypothetical protein
VTATTQALHAPRPRVRVELVSGAATESLPADAAVVLLAPLPAGRDLRPLTVATRGAGAEIAVHDLQLAGLSARYLGAIAAAASAAGWSAGEVLALVAALEERCRAWLAAPSLAALEHAGLLARPRARRVRGAEFAHGAWEPAPPSPAAFLALARAGLRPGSIAIAATSGRGVPAALQAAVDGSGVRSARLARGTAAELGTRWAVELLVAPRVTRAGLSSLREQLAAAPRCGWCGLPTLAERCRRRGAERRR